MVYTKVHLAILSRLFCLRCIGKKHTSKENALRGLPKNLRGEGESCFRDLRKWNMILVKPTHYGEQVSLNPDQIRDIKLLLNPSDNDIVDKPPVEDSLDSRYEKRSFHKSLGEKTIKGINATYSYHRSLSDPTKILCYVIVEGVKQKTILLGSDNDPDSLFSKFIMRSDEKFKGKVFTKPDVYKLGDDIEGNRQPPKALIDMGIFFSYLVEVGTHHYQRTSKQLPKTRIDEYVPSAAKLDSTSLHK